MDRARRDPARALGARARRRAADPACSTRSPRSTRARSAIRRARSTCCRPRSSATTRTTRPRSELERLATATNRWQELLDEYTNRVNELEREDRGAAADLWVKIGRWYGEHLSHLEYAIHSVQQALRIDPAHTGALGGMAELQRKRGSWSELIETLQRHAAVEPTPEKKTELYIDLAELLERQMQDIGGAIHAYQQALDPRPAVAARRSPRSIGSTAAPSSGSR